MRTTPIAAVPIVRAMLASLCLLGSRAWGTDADHVIHISLDGCRGDLLATMLAQDTNGELANFRRFVDEGASTFNARADYTHTITLPNHTSMLTGRPVLQPAAQPNTVHHGYTDNSDPGATVTLHNSGNPNLSYVASVFDVAHDAGLSTALYVSKSKFVLYDRSYDAAHGAPDSVLPDYGADKIDHYVYLSSAAMHAAFLSEMALDDYAYCFVHYQDLDTVGHTDGWGSTSWQAAMRTVDDYLGEIFLLATTDAELAGRTAIVLTSDHGGIGTAHSNAASVENYTIPVLAWGAGVARGVDFYTLNPSSRQNPGSSRPDYDVRPQPLRNGDTGNLTLRLLGLASVPGSTLNSAQDLVAGAPASVRSSGWTEIKTRFR